MQNNKVKTVIKENEQPEPIEVLESAIVELAKGMQKLRTTRLKESAIITLLSRASGVGRSETEKILECLMDLENLFLKKK